MRWLWRDWPAAIQAQSPGNPVLKAILQLGEGWQVVADGCAPSIAANPQGQVFYSGGEITDGHSMECGQADAALAFGSDGKRYLARPEGGVKVGDSGVLGDGLPIRALTVRHSGDMYAVTPDELWFIRATGEKVRLDEGLKGASGVALSPDGLWLFVAQSFSRNGLSYRVHADGSVDARAPFYDFDIPNWADDSGAAGIGMDHDGRAYVAARTGVQVFDRNGRVAGIIPLPGNAAATGLCFGGPDFDTLYVAGGGKVYRRKLHSVGAPPWADPFKLPPWGAG
jgi:gluconolactonase